MVQGKSWAVTPRPNDRRRQLRMLLHGPLFSPVSGIARHFPARTGFLPVHFLPDRTGFFAPARPITLPD